MTAGETAERQSVMERGILLKNMVASIEGETGEVINLFFDQFPSWEDEFPIDGAREAAEEIKKNTARWHSLRGSHLDYDQLIKCAMIYGYMKGREDEAIPVETL